MEPHSLYSLLELPVTERTWIVPYLVPANGITILTGPPASMKTFFALWLAYRFSAGKSIFDEPASKVMFPPVKVNDTTNLSTVLFIEEENDVGLVKFRIKKMVGSTTTSAEKLAVAQSRLLFLVEHGVKLDNPQMLDTLTQICEEMNVKLIIGDPMSALHSAQSENDATQMSEFMLKLRQRFTKNGISVFLIHHPAKAYGSEPVSKIRGSGDILAKIDSHIHLEREEGGQDTFLLTQHKLRTARQLDTPLRIKFNGEKNSFEYLSGPRPSYGSPSEQTSIAVPDF